MAEEKKKDEEKEDLVSRMDRVLNLRGIKGKDLAKMSVEEMVKGEGLLPFNPMHIVSDEDAEKLGAHAGLVYGASIASIGQSFTRDDLPLDKRVRLGIKGVRPILAAFISAWETSKILTDKEAEILGIDLLESAGVRGSARGESVTAAEVIAELRKELKLSKDDRELLRKELEEIKIKGKK